MNEIKIVDYENDMKILIRELFRSIYPGQNYIVEKMCYDKEAPGHIVTKVAFDGDMIAGQANIFIKKKLGGSPNLGCHVHPDKRRQGIAKALSMEAINVAKSKGIKEIYILMDKNNNASIAVARSLGFIRDSSKYEDKETLVFRKILT